MQITQNYARPSAGVMEADGMRLGMSAEQSRPPVHLEAMVKDSLAYARLMLALYEVVSRDYRPQQKDHSAYQEWVQQRYLEELPEARERQAARELELQQRRQELAPKVAELQRDVRALQPLAGGAVFHKAMYQYFGWLYAHDKEAWYVLDPVVSVHPDCLIFEVFSLDESSYGRVTVPTDRLETLGETVYGTTNIDFSRSLADEIARVRSYRRAWLQVGGEGVTLTTGAGEAVEKKIDLPPSWVRGFLQVQSASAFPATELTLSAATLAEVLSILRREKEDRGPRSLRFRLTPGQKPIIIVEPWNIEVHETEHLFHGNESGDIRIWGRRRLFALEGLMPYAESIGVRLLGVGMPSYWTVFQKDHRFDLGLSGWTKNDWAQSARFDLLSTTTTASEKDTAAAAELLTRRLRLSAEELSTISPLSRSVAAAALQRLCAEGQAMYDPAIGSYRWRPLFAFPVKLDGDEDKRLAAARRLVSGNAVRWLGPGEGEEGSPSRRSTESTRLRANVRGEKEFQVTLDIDADGRVEYAECTCSWHRREKLRKGPCAHILAVSALATRSLASTGAAQ